MSRDKARLPVFKRFSDLIRMIPQSSDRLFQALIKQGLQKLAGRLRRVFEASPLLFEGVANRVWHLLDKLHQKMVGMCCNHAVTGEIFRRKVLQIESDNSLRACLDSRRQNMPVVGVWQLERLYQWLMTGHKRITNGKVHQVTCSRHLFRRNS